MDRMGSGTIIVENMALSLYGNCQPTVFRNNVDSTSADGILQRFMPVVLNPDNNAMWQDSIPSFMSGEHAYEQLIRRSYALPPMEYTLSPEGLAILKAFSAWALQFREAERILSSSTTYQTALGKVEGNCARLLLLFHLVESPYEMVIGPETVIRVTRLFRTFFIPSLRHVFLHVGEQSDPMAKKAFDVISQWASVRPTITLPELRTGTKTAGDTRPPWQIDQLLRVIMDDLCSMGYTSLLQDHPRYPVWTINPAVADLFKAHRTKVIKAKQAVIDKIEREVGMPWSQFPDAIGRHTVD
jgi:hypothetical protein